MTTEISQAEFQGSAINAVADPWVYVAINAGLTTLFVNQTVNIFDDARQLASEVTTGLVTEAQKFQRASQLWTDLAASLSSEMDGMRARLNATQTIWADKAIDAMQSAFVLDDIVQTKNPARFVSLAAELGRCLGGIVSAVQLISALNKGDDTSGPSVNDIAKAVLGVGVGILVAAFAPVSLTGIALGVAMGLVTDVAYDMLSDEMLSSNFRSASFWDVFFDFFSGQNVSGVSNSAFNSARAFIQQRDPLVLDLDGDGLELVAASGNTLFDHNADGIKTGTGWAGADDGFLVRDLNGNGVIDTGRELFGVDTVKSNGQLATQGFDALADLDSNADGQITSADAAWSQLQVWRDANQDGISQSNEISTLGALNITRIGVNGSSAGSQAGQTINNNRVALSTTYTRAGVNRTVGAIDLEANGFFSEIPPEVVDEAGNPVTVTETAAALPQMNGSGMVRNLQAAMSLSGTAADELEVALTAFAAATTRDAQRAQIDSVITEWAQTSSYWNSLESTLGGTVTVNPPAGMTAEQYRNMVAVLEAFNGSRFYSTMGDRLPEGTLITSVNGVTHVTLFVREQQVIFLKQAYAALAEGVYEALVVQTRLKPYLDSIELVIDENGVSFDTAALSTMLQSQHAESPQTAIEDMAELIQFSGSSLYSMGFHATGQMRQWVDALAADSPLRALLGQLSVFTDGAAVGADNRDIYLGNSANNMFSAGANNDMLDGGTGNDTLSGNSGADVLIGGAGNDTLYGAGLYGGGGLGDDDTLDGGAGNDVLVGGMGSDVYLFGRGDGQDSINNMADGWGGAADPNPNKQDVLRFKEGVLSTDVTLSRSGDSLIAKINGTSDQVTIQNHFINGGVSSQGYALHAILFADGTEWSAADIKAKVLVPTDSADQITGYAGDDSLQGLAGNDILKGAEGNDALNGGDGNDALYGEDGNDTLMGELGADMFDGGAGADVLDGGDGNDTLSGNSGADVLIGGAGNDTLYGAGLYGGGGLGDDDTLDGGAGNDHLVGGMGSDVYLFGRGDGQDSISNYADAWGGQADPNPNKQDVLRFKEGVLSTEVTLSRSGDSLVAKINGTSDQVTVQSHFTNGGVTPQGYALHAIRFADGTEWSAADIKAKVLQGGEGNDVITGYATADAINGLGGNDVISGRDGHDSILGGDGDDNLNGEIGDDSLDGGAGNDTLYGGNGNDVLIGGEGNDSLYAASTYGQGVVGAMDVLDGGAGNDMLRGGFGSQTYLFGRGDGQDTISNDADGYSASADPTVGKQDVLQFKAGIASSDVTLSRSGDSLIAKVNGSTVQVMVQNYFVADGLSTRGFAVDAIRFDDGTSWNITQVKAMVLVPTEGADQISGYAGDDSLQGLGGNDILKGAAGNDTLIGGDGDDALYGEDGNDNLVGGSGADTLDGGVGADVLDGGDGNDTLYGQGGADILIGGAGNDTLYGAGLYGGGGLGDDDTLDGGAGNDRLVGGMGSDVYLFGRGDGQDSIENWADASSGQADVNPNKQDVLRFKEGVLSTEVTLSRSGDNLIAKIIGTTDQVTVYSHFTNGGVTPQGYALHAIRFADGTEWSAADIKAKVLVPTDSADQITGYAGDDSLQGLAGNDILKGAAGNDTLHGGNDNDALYGEDGNDSLMGELGVDMLDGGVGADVLDGGDGIDTLYGQGGADILIGGAGNDTLYGAGLYGGGGLGDDDTLDGGAGNDALMGGMGSDVYLFGRGDGQDSVNNAADAWGGQADPNPNKQDVLRFKEGVLSTEVTLSRSGDSLIAKINGTSDQVMVSNHFFNGGVTPQGYALHAIRFADGTEWSAADIKAKVLQGGTGNDVITGYASDDVLNGGAGNDVLNGLTGNDTLDGGAGSDTLAGGAGNDTYVLGLGYGAETVQENDATSGNTDLLRFLEGVATDQIWFRQVSNNLEVSIIGTSDKATVTNWYAGSQYKVEQFQTADNQTLLSSQVDALVSAMAAFSPPPPGQTTLTPAQQSALSPVIAANWN